VTVTGGAGGGVSLAAVDVVVDVDVEAVEVEVLVAEALVDGVGVVLASVGRVNGRAETLASLLLLLLLTTTIAVEVTVTITTAVLVGCSSFAEGGATTTVKVEVIGAIAETYTVVVYGWKVTVPSERVCLLLICCVPLVQALRFSHRSGWGKVESGR
jgi:hypothetical protein